MTIGGTRENAISKKNNDNHNTITLLGPLQTRVTLTDSKAKPTAVDAVGNHDYHGHVYNITGVAD